MTIQTKSIFNIEAEYLAIMQELEFNAGELTPELDTALEINKINFKDKMKAYRLNTY